MKKKMKKKMKNLELSEKKKRPWETLEKGVEIFWGECRLSPVVQIRTVPSHAPDANTLSWKEKRERLF